MTMKEGNGFSSEADSRLSLATWRVSQHAAMTDGKGSDSYCNFFGCLRRLFLMHYLTRTGHG